MIEEMLEDVSKLSEYFLFGSRSIAKLPPQENFDPKVMIGSQINSSTDWDFAAHDTDENHEILIRAGYTYFSSENLIYKDDLTTGVYIKTYHNKNKMGLPYIKDLPVANVVLKNDFYLFKNVWESIDPKFYHDHLWKRSPNYDGQSLSLTKETICDILNQMFRTAKHML